MADKDKTKPEENPKDRQENLNEKSRLNSISSSKSIVQSVLQIQEAKNLKSPIICICLLIILFVLIFLFIFLVVPIASIQLGYLYCDTEPLIPVWLIVLGVETIVFMLLILGITGCGVCSAFNQKAAVDDYNERVQRGEIVASGGGEQNFPGRGPKKTLDRYLVPVIFLITLFVVFSFIWLLLGNYWVFGAYDEITGENGQCSEEMFNFALAVIYFWDAFVILGLLLFCFLICVAVVVFVVMTAWIMLE